MSKRPHFSFFLVHDRNHGGATTNFYWKAIRNRRRYVLISPNFMSRTLNLLYILNYITRYNLCHTVQSESYVNWIKTFPAFVCTGKCNQEDPTRAGYPQEGVRSPQRVSVHQRSCSSSSWTERICRIPDPSGVLSWSVNHIPVSVKYVKHFVVHWTC